MAKITGTGAPTSKTQAAVGDIYTDTTNGKQYKCKCAYKSNHCTFPNLQTHCTS